MQLGDTFGVLQSQASIGIKIFAEHMKMKWMYLITDNLEFWLPMFPSFAESIEEKLRSEDVHIEIGTNLIIGFIELAISQGSELCRLRLRFNCVIQFEC